MKVGGVIYTFPIYPGRISRNDRANLKVFQEICGQKNLTKVALATTRWDGTTNRDVLEGREAELRQKFWQDMLGDPESPMASMARLENTSGSAWELVDHVLGRLLHADVDGVILKLQKQLVDKQKDLRETSAAQELLKKLTDLLKESGSSDLEGRRKSARELATQIKELKTPLTKRIMRFLKSVSFCSKPRKIW